jgi:hypothetical protein
VSALAAARAGLRAMARNWGLALLLLLLSVLIAGTLALPLSSRMEAELQNKDAAANMTYGFDFNWWSEWHDRQQHAWPATFSPEVFGIGFAYRNLDLMLKGALPAGLMAKPAEPNDPALDPLLLELGGLYVLVQVFLTGGVLGVLRAPAGGWTVRGLLHGSGFYFGRLLRLALVSLAVLWILFQLYAPFASWTDLRARDAVSERTAMVWTIGRHLLLLLAILFVNMVNGYAKAAIVLEERSSALLAWISSFSFCLRHLGRVALHYALLAAAVVLLLGVWNLLDGAWNTTGYKTQILTLLLLQGFVFGRIFLRLALLGGQLEIYRGAA